MSHEGAAPATLSAREKAICERLKDDFPHYAAKYLRIRPKEVTGGELPALKLNRAQLYIHERLEAQLKRRGFVRAIVLKGRQQGCSTYVEARFYWKGSHLKGVSAYILTHEDAATVNLFDMAKRYHDHIPTLVMPSTSASNAAVCRPLLRGAGQSDSRAQHCLRYQGTVCDMRNDEG